MAASVLGVAAAGAGAFAATNWIVGLGSGSSGESQSANVSNLTVTAVASPAAGNLLFPGSAGDVVAKITNPNSFPVTVTAVTLPSATTYGVGYSNSALSAAVTGCSATTPSDVTWSYADGGSHTLNTPLTVGANSNLTVTLTNDASMGAAAPAACENIYFQMPSLTGVTATGGAGGATPSPATDYWNS